MLIEFLAGQNEVMEKEIQSIESNNINIEFFKNTGGEKCKQT